MLAALRRDNVDLTAPAEIGCYLDMPSLDGARGAARDLRELGWHVDVHIAQDESSWMVHACRQLAPTWPNVCAMREEMDRVARAHDGAYDGWGIAPS